MDWRRIFLASSLGLGFAALPLLFWASTRSPRFVLGGDFTNLWTAGRLVLEGRLESIYDVVRFRAELANHVGVTDLQNFSYPPHDLFFALPFGALPYSLALAAWTVGGAIFFCWAARPHLPVAWLAVLTPAALVNIWAGHYGFWIGGLWLLAFRYLPDRPARSGLMAGLMTIKPHLGLFVAVAMLSKRRALAGAVASTLVLIAASAVAFGHWGDFLRGTSSLQVGILTSTEGEYYFRMMPSAYVAFGHSIPAQLAFAAVAVALLVRSRRVDGFAFATATFVVLPYSFNYDMTAASVGFLVPLLSRETSLSSRAVFAAALVTPLFCYIAPHAVPIALLAALYLQTRPKSAAFVAKDVGAPTPAVEYAA